MRFCRLAVSSGLVVALALSGLAVVATPAAAIGSPNLVISEFRLQGPGGASDEFVDIQNASAAAVTVASIDTSGGFALAASDGTARFVIPDGTIIPAGGHYLGVNSTAYSLATYPAGSGTTATGDATYTTDIPNNAGIALFNTATAANFDVAHRLDAVGSTSEANTTYKEGTGYPALTPFSVDQSFYRDLASGTPKDTDDNAADFLYVDTNGTSAGAGQRLGAPGPENLSGPTTTGAAALAVSLFDPGATPSQAPNLARDTTPAPASNSTFGTVTVRRRITNNTGSAIPRLRFRVVGITTFPTPAGNADLRPRTSADTAAIPLTGGGTATAHGTTLEQPPSQPNGGGFNSTLSSDSVTTATPLANGASIDVQFLLGIQQTGSLKFLVIAETPNGSNAPFGCQFGATGEGPFAVASCPSALSTSFSLVISEFRLRGPSGAGDEFVDIQNTAATEVAIGAADASSGFALAASDGVARFVIPNGTLIPAGGHYLGVNSTAYGLGSYPAGPGTTAAGDATYTTDIPDNAGIALFNTATPASFDVAHRLDAVGSTSEANTAYKEGTGYPALTPFSIDSSFYRDLASGAPKDTGDNAADFLFVDTNGTSAGAGQRLGAPGPENQSGPTTTGTAALAVSLFDPGATPSQAPNLVRDGTADSPSNSTFGTVTVRRTITNNTGDAIPRLRFRVVGITTFPSPSGTSDLRVRTVGDTAAIPLTGGGTATAHGTTLEQPPSQPNGGGFNSTVSSGFVTLAAPLADGASVNVQFLLGIQQTGSLKFLVIAETPNGSNGPFGCGSGATGDGASVLPDCGNAPPTISDTTDKSTAEDTPTGALPITVGDTETPAGSLVVTASSSNTTLVPNANLALGGSGANRTLTITPAPDQNGTTTITVSVSDDLATTSDTFVLTVTAVNDAPTISHTPNQSTAEDTPTPPLPITVGDVETAPGSLTVTASSSNTTLVPNANLALGGSGANRTLTITPAPDRGGDTTITVTVSDGAISVSDAFVLTVSPQGYLLAAANGVVQGFGAAQALGSAPGPLNRPIVDLERTHAGRGYWLAASDGGVFSFGDGPFLGSLGGMALNKPIVGMASTPSRGGYWLVAQDGGVFAFGDAPYLGSMAGVPLNRPIVGMAATPTGRGYWLITGDDGVVFAFGDAAFFGSMAGTVLNRPIVSIAVTPTGHGYWLVALDGGVFSFGDAKFFGSTGGLKLNRPIVSMAVSPTGLGYWLIAQDGGVFTYGDAKFLGSLGSAGSPSPIVGS
jgi:hypothetical protein